MRRSRAFDGETDSKTDGKIEFKTGGTWASAGNTRRAGEAILESADQNHAHPFSFGVDRLGLAALKAPAVAALLIVALTAAAVAGLLRLKVDDSLSELFRTNTQEFRTYEEIDRRFPSSEYDVLVVVEGKKLLTRDGLTAFSNAASELQLADGVSGLPDPWSGNPG